MTRTMVHAGAHFALGVGFSLFQQMELQAALAAVWLPPATINTDFVAFSAFPKELKTPDLNPITGSTATTSRPRCSATIISILQT